MLDFTRKPDDLGLQKLLCGVCFMSGRNGLD